MDGKIVEQLFRSVPCPLTVTVSPTGLGAEQARFLEAPIRLQSQWADLSPKRRLSRTIDDSMRDPTYDQKQNNYEITDKYTRYHII